MTDKQKKVTKKRPKKKGGLDPPLPTGIVIARHGSPKKLQYGREDTVIPTLRCKGAMEDR